MLRELEDWRPNPEEKFASAEIRDILDDLLDQLKPKYGIVLVLRDLEELSIKETASVLGLSVPSVKTRLLRARLRLRRGDPTFGRAVRCGTFPGDLSSVRRAT